MTNYGDERSKEMFALKMLKSGFKVWDADYVSEEQYKFRPDLYGERNGVLYAYEIKARNIPSTKFGDILISEHKLNLYEEHPEVQYYLVFFYTDGIGYILEPNQPHTIEEKPTKRTTYFSDQSVSMERKAIYQTSVAKRFKFDPQLIYETSV